MGSLMLDVGSCPRHWIIKKDLTKIVRVELVIALVKCLDQKMMKS